jgi:UDP:flavonoid glycosyltransferase YjiC (YdhE family)
MARILFCWELGGALGHLSTVQALATRLHALGHELHLATTAAMAANAPRMPVSFHAVRAWRHSRGAVRNVRTYAHVLCNVGYGDPQQLIVQLRAWKEIFRQVRPDVLICESSPTALLAVRGMNIPTINVGLAFSIPPRIYPLPDLHHWEPAGSSSFSNDEDVLTETINTVLAAEQLPPIPRLHDMFAATYTAVCSVPELDAYCDRPPESHVGEISRLPGQQAHWPAASGKRVFAYLKPFPEVIQLLDALRQRELSALIYAPSLPHALTSKYRNARVHFVDRPLDVSHTLRTASLVITHGHGLTLQALQAGVPVFGFPLTLEQHIVARRVAALNVGSFCSPWGSNRIAHTLDTLLDDESFTRNAQAFASRYAHLDPDTQATGVATRIAALAA